MVYPSLPLFLLLFLCPARLGTGRMCHGVESRTVCVTVTATGSCPFPRCYRLLTYWVFPISDRQVDQYGGSLFGELGGAIWSRLLPQAYAHLLPVIFCLPSKVPAQWFLFCFLFVFCVFCLVIRVYVCLRLALIYVDPYFELVTDPTHLLGYPPRQTLYRFPVYTVSKAPPFRVCAPSLVYPTSSPRRFPGSGWL